MRLLPNVFLKDKGPCRDRTYKEFYALDTFKKIAFEGFPEFVESKQQWRCHRCGQWLSGLAVQVHQCRAKAEIDPLQLEAAGLVRSNCSCSLCGVRVGSEAHICQSPIWDTYAYDLSHMLDYGAGNELTWGGDDAKQMIRELRRSSVPVVIISRDMNKKDVLVKCHTFLAASDLPGLPSGSNRGLFTMQPLSTTGAAITRKEERIFKDSGIPVLSRRVVCCYSGLQISKEELDARPLDADLSVNTITYKGKDTYVDPSEKGGFAVVINQAHPHRLNLEPCVMRVAQKQAEMWLVAQRAIEAGSELYWDYCAVTTNPEDPLLKVMCACCGTQALVSLV